MTEPLTVEQVSEAIYKVVAGAQGVRKLKPTDVSKMVIEQFGPERCTKDLCKAAIRTLVDSGRCIYTYFGGSYLELPRTDDNETA